MQIKATITTIGRTLVAVAIITATCSNRATAEFKQPQETSSCSFDKDDKYDGITYQNIRIGVSFAELKRLMDDSHHALLAKKRSEYAGEWIYDSADDWQISNITNWRPSFWFIEDKGVYRLWQIKGKVSSDFKIMKRIMDTLTAKYGRPVSRDANAPVWESGSAHKTFADLNLVNSELSFFDLDLLRVGVQQKKYRAPNR